MTHTNKARFLAALLLLCLLLSACGKSEAVVNVESQIADIGTVGTQSLREIEEAEKLYDALEDKEKRKVENASALEQARAEYNQLMSGQVDEKIDLIGTVSTQSLRKIRDAESAYNALTDEQKSLVIKYDVLLAARETYNHLMSSQVDEKIDLIGTVSIQSLEQIKAAEFAYNALTDEQKSLVTKYNVLLAARETCNAMLVVNAETLIQSVQYTGTEEPDAALEDTLKKAHQAYEALPAELRAQVSNHSHLADVEAAVSQFYIDRAQAAIDAAIVSDSGYEQAEELYFELTDEQMAKIKNIDEFLDCYIAYLNKPPVELISYTLKKNSIGNPELYLKAKNVSDKIIKGFSGTVFAFDSDGVPVDVYFGDYAKGIYYSSAIKVGESTKSNSYWTLYGTYSEMKQIVVILREVEFFDGSIWENTQYGTLYDKYEQQLLADNDKNVLPRK